MTKQNIKLDIEFPTWDLDKEVISIVNALGKFGGSLSKSGLQEELSIPHGSLGGPISSAKRYELIKNEEGTKSLGLTQLGWQVFKAKTDEERKMYLTRAFLNVQEFKKLVIEKNFHDLPQLSTIKKIFQDEYDVPEKYSARLAGLFRSNFSLLGCDFESLKGIIENKSETSTYSDKEQSVSEKSNESDGNEFIDGIRLGFKLAKMSQEKPSKEAVNELLEMLILETGEYPKLKNMLAQVKEMVSDGYMPADKAMDYVNDKIGKMFGVEQADKQEKTKDEK